MGFSRQEYQSGLPCPPPGDLPDPGIETASPVTPALQVDSLLLTHQGSLSLVKIHFQGMSQSRAISWIFPACCHFCSLLIICMTASSSGQGASVWLLYSPGQEHGRFSVNIRCCSQPPHPSPPAPARAPLGLQASKLSLRLLRPWDSPGFSKEHLSLSCTAQFLAVYIWLPGFFMIPSICFSKWSHGRPGVKKAAYFSFISLSPES